MRAALATSIQADSEGKPTSVVTPIFENETASGLAGVLICEPESTNHARDVGEISTFNARLINNEIIEYL
jgi:hypothetical protein